MVVPGVRPADRRLLAWMGGLFLVTQAGHGLGANTGDALFFVRFGVEFLPHMIALSGLVVMVTLVVYGAGLSQWGARRFLPAMAWALAGLLVAERALVPLDLPLLYPAIWLSEQVAIMATFTMMWTAAGEGCDLRRAKRLFPTFASAGIAGGFLGNLFTGPLADLLGTPNLLVVHAGLLGSMGLLLVGIGSRFFGPLQLPDRSALADLREGLMLTVRSRFLRLVAGTAFLFSLLFFMVVFPFSEQVAASFPDEAGVARFLGFFSATATATTFLVSLLVANRLFAWIGVVGTVLVVPVVYLLGFGLWAGGLTLTTAALVRGAQWVAVNGLGGTAFSSLFNVLGSRRRGQVMAFMTGIPTQSGVVASGALLIAVAPRLTSMQLAVLGLAIAAATSLLVWRMRAAYQQALLAALREGLVGVFTTPSQGLAKVQADADALAAVQRTMEDPRPEVRRLAAGMLGQLGGEAVVSLLTRSLSDQDDRVRLEAARSLARVGLEKGVPALVGALGDPDPAVRETAVDGLGALGAPPPPELERMLHDQYPAVRARAACVLGGGMSRDVLAGMLGSESEEEVRSALEALVLHPDLARDLSAQRFLGHPDPAMRVRAARLVARMRDASGLVDLLEDSDPQVRETAAAELRQRPELAPAVQKVLRAGSETGQEAAVGTLGGNPAARPALLEWASAQVERATRLRRHRIALAASPEDGLVSARYLHKLLGQREWHYERRSLLAVEILAGRESLRLLRRGAGTADPQLRGQALEALDTIGDRRLTGRLLPLLEEAPAPSGEPATSSGWALLDDPDPWVRALAIRVMGDRLAAEAVALQDRAASDPAPLVREAVAWGKRPMSESLQTMGVVDRVLVLQQVPMFSELEPEDLARIAELATERHYEPEEPVYREGEPGDDMLVLASGRVRVSKEIDGEQRVIRTFEAGEHVGELALLRRQPRAADVIADKTEVRGLEIRAADFEAILEERPRVAMAMLGTLAERLGTTV